MNIDPHSLEFTVKECLLAYPSIFPTRDRVIEHLFCVLGNGYDWKDGALVDDFDSNEHVKSGTVRRMILEGRPEEEIRAWVAKEDKDRLDRMYKDMMERLPSELRERFYGAEHPHFEQPLRIYPLCELCSIMELPKDIRPDWLAGAEEALRLVETIPSFDDARTVENREKWVPRIRALIKERRRKSA